MTDLTVHWMHCDESFGLELRSFIYQTHSTRWASNCIHITSWQHHCFSQVSGHVRMSAKCWDTRTDAGALQLQDQTRAWPAVPICQHFPRQLHFPGTPEGKTTTHLTCPKPAVFRVCMKKFNTRNLITFSLVHRHQREYRKQTKFPSQSIQKLKKA